jgi:hypothetical protein
VFTPLTGSHCKLHPNTEGASVMAASDAGLTPLLAACFSGHAAVASVLLNHGADVDVVTRDTGRTPLYAAAQEGHVEVIELLARRGADLNKSCGLASGVTALWIASQNGHWEAVEVLCSHGADLEKGKIIHTTRMQPLLVAAYNGHTRVLQALACWGARMDGGGMGAAFGIVGSDSPRQVAVRLGHTELAEWLTEMKDCTVLEIAALCGNSKAAAYGARFSTDIYTRGCHWFPTPAPLEALACVRPMPFISGVHGSYRLAL